MQVSRLCESASLLWSAVQPWACSSTLLRILGSSQNRGPALEGPVDLRGEKSTFKHAALKKDERPGLTTRVQIEPVKTAFTNSPWGVDEEWLENLGSCVKGARA